MHTRHTHPTLFVPAAVAVGLFFTLSAHMTSANAQPAVPPAPGASVPAAPPAPAATVADGQWSLPFVTINGQVRNRAQAELLLREQLQRGAPNTPQLQAAVRDALINQALMAQAAEKAGLAQLPLVQAQIELARQNTLAQAWQETVLRETTLTEADLKAEYERQVKLLGPEAFQLRHLLVAEEATAKLLIDRIKGGATLASLAPEFSRDEATKAQGGLSPLTPQGELLPAIREAVRALKKGQLVQTPVRSPLGWHVLQLEDRRPYQPPGMDAVKPQLTQALAQQRLQARLEALRQSAKVE